MPVKPGSPSVPLPGYAVEVLDEHGSRVPAGTEGAICIRLPLPPGTLPTLWQDDERYVAEYLSAFDGYYLTGDGGLVDEDGYLFVMGRTDGEPALIGIGSRPRRFAAIGHPVSVCHQLSTTGTPVTLLAHS